MRYCISSLIFFATVAAWWRPMASGYTHQKAPYLPWLGLQKTKKSGLERVYASNARALEGAGREGASFYFPAPASTPQSRCLKNIGTNHVTPDALRRRARTTLTIAGPKTWEKNAASANSSSEKESATPRPRHYHPQHQQNHALSHHHRASPPTHLLGRGDCAVDSSERYAEGPRCGFRLQAQHCPEGNLLAFRGRGTGAERSRRVQGWRPRPASWDSVRNAYDSQAANRGRVEKAEANVPHIFQGQVESLLEKIVWRWFAARPPPFFLEHRASRSVKTSWKRRNKIRRGMSKEASSSQSSLALPRLTRHVG